MTGVFQFPTLLVIYCTIFAEQCCQMGSFPAQLGYFFRCTAGNFLLLRVAALFGRVLSKCMRYFGLFLRKIFYPRV